MSLGDVLPTVQSLSREDKLRLIQYLAQDLVRQETSGVLSAGQAYPVWSPHDAYAAADVLMRALEQDNAMQ